MSRWAGLTLAMCLVASPASADDGRRRTADSDWAALHRRSREALIGLSQAGLRADGEATEVRADVARPRTIVVGFTGGLEGQNSSVSGVVRLRRSIDDRFGETADVTALAYNNFKWQRAASEVVALVRQVGRDEAGDRVTPPIIVVYGHSWGAGAIGKFARELRREGLDVSLAIYIDAFTLRNPRVPDNVQYAVNLYQRTGLLRGLPLRGKKRLTAESPESTVILGSLRIKPVTKHFGWNWNLVQPLLYRHHHRIGHDVRIQSYLLELLSLHLEQTDTASAPPGL